MEPTLLLSHPVVVYGWSEDPTFLLSHMVLVCGWWEDPTIAIQMIKPLQCDTHGRKVMLRYTDIEKTFSLDV